MGHSQVVTPAQNLIDGYHKVCELAEKSKDTASIEKLKSLGAPPYSDARKAGQLIRVIKKYERERSTPAPEGWWQPALEYDNEVDGNNRYEGDDYSFIQYMGHEKLGIKDMFTTIDFMKDGMVFDVPVYFIQGEMDILTPREATKRYFEKIKAPRRSLLPNTAHGHNQAVVEKQYEVVMDCCQ